MGRSAETRCRTGVRRVSCGPAGLASGELTVATVAGGRAAGGGSGVRLGGVVSVLCVMTATVAVAVAVRLWLRLGVVVVLTVAKIRAGGTAAGYYLEQVAK